MKPILYIYDEIFLKHDTGSHPENKDRLIAIDSAINNSKVRDKVFQIKPIRAQDEDLKRIHDMDYIDRAREVISSGAHFLDSMDTIVCNDSLDAAYFAAGSGILAADKIIKGEHEVAFCAVRPPGHHAEKDHSMGFCIFNNIAITARYLQEKHNLERIFILDWDVHHGNATEHSFYNDDSVYYVSLHQYPHYPGTGALNDRGAGKGENFNRNFPMPADRGDKEYLEAFDEIANIIKDFRPEFILLSSGFDGHIRDPLSNINLSSKVFGTFTEKIKSVSDSAQGRVISFLEGGYDLQGLSQSVVHHLEALPK